MEENKTFQAAEAVELPPTGKSFVFAIGFTVVYAAILLIILEVFFSFPF